MKRKHRALRPSLTLVLIGIVGCGLMSLGQTCLTDITDGVLTNPYASHTFDHATHSASYSCDSCHHTGAGNVDCSTCHTDDVSGDTITLKDAMHDSTGGCRLCHNTQTSEGLWDCSFCHTGL